MNDCVPVVPQGSRSFEKVRSSHNADQMQAAQKLVCQRLAPFENPRSFDAGRRANVERKTKLTVRTAGQLNPRKWW